MIEEQKAKALFAGGVALFVTGLVVLMLFVIPAARHSDVAMAQDDEMPVPPEVGEMGPAGPEMEPGGMEPGMEGMGPGMGGAMAGAGAGAPAGGAGVLPLAAEPLEPSRPNPFAPRVAAELAEAAAVAATTYGPDWSRLPIGESVGFVRPEVPPAPTPPLPPLERAAEVKLRITSIMWDASGGAIAAYEDEEGKTGQLKPGERAPIPGYRVKQITQTGVTLEDPTTGAVQELELRPRTEKKEEPARRPRLRRGEREPRTPRGGQEPRGRQRPRGGGFPAEPPGA